VRIFVIMAEPHDGTASIPGRRQGMSTLDDVPTAVESSPYRTPLEDSLLAITSAMSAEANVEALLERILDEARVFTRAEAGNILVVDGDHLKFAVVQNDLLAARFGARELRRRYQTLPLPLTEQSLATHVALTGATLNLEDAYANHMVGPVFNRAIDESNDYRTRSLLALPLQTADGTVLGVMELVNARRGAGGDVIVPFTAETERLARSYASLAGVAIHRAVLDESNFKDTLTDLYNRRYLSMRVDEEAGRYKRFGHPVSVVSMDLDNFDRINRKAGHPGGDAVLREVGVLLRRNSRRFTVVARDRGDDFAIVLPNTPRTGAVTYAERIKALVERHPFEHGKVTASLGVASLPDSATVPDELLGGAYTSVADAKRRGGNRVAVL
jgi:diguanylate cyclase (GGDEF)-like protein